MKRRGTWCTHTQNPQKNNKEKNKNKTYSKETFSPLRLGEDFLVEERNTRISEEKEKQCGG